MAAVRKTPPAAEAAPPEAAVAPSRPVARPGPPASGPGLTVQQQHARLSKAYAGRAAPEFGRYPGWVRVLILVAAASGAWMLTIGAAQIALRVLGR